MPSVTFSIPSDANAVRWACLAVRGILDGVRLAEDDRYYVELAVSEVVTNSLRHAYENKPGNEIGLDVAVEEDRLVVSVSDTGLPLDPERIEAANLPLDNDSHPEQGGRGLFLVRQAMDEVTFGREGECNVLTMTKRHGGVK